MNVESSPLADLMGKLESMGCNPRLRDGQGSARCPAHDDRTASLTFREGDDGRALVHCHAGCPIEAIVTALDLPMSALFPQGKSEGRRSRRRPKKTEPSFGPENDKFGAVPPCLILNACPVCLQVYAYLAWRCGKQNISQHGVRAIARAIGAQPRTVTAHARHLAETGWITFSAEVTTTGTLRSSKLSLRNCPALHIVNPDALTPSRKHGVTGGGVARSTRYANRSPDALNAPSSARSTRYPAKDVARSTRDTLGTWYEHVGLGDEDSGNEHLADDEDFEVVMVRAGFPGAVSVVSPGPVTRCAGCVRLVTPAPAAVEAGCPTLCPDCYAAKDGS